MIIRPRLKMYLKLNEFKYSAKKTFIVMKSYKKLAMGSNKKKTKFKQFTTHPFQ